MNKLNIYTLHICWNFACAFWVRFKSRKNVWKLKFETRKTKKKTGNRKKKGAHGPKPLVSSPFTPPSSQLLLVSFGCHSVGLRSTRHVSLAVGAHSYVARTIRRAATPLTRGTATSHLSPTSNSNRMAANPVTSVHVPYLASHTLGVASPHLGYKM